MKITRATRRLLKKATTLPEDERKSISYYLALAVGTVYYAVRKK